MKHNVKVVKSHRMSYVAKIVGTMNTIDRGGGDLCQQLLLLAIRRFFKNTMTQCHPVDMVKRLAIQNPSLLGIILWLEETDQPINIYLPYTFLARHYREVGQHFCSSSTLIEIFCQLASASY